MTQRIYRPPTFEQQVFRILAVVICAIFCAPSFALAQTGLEQDLLSVSFASESEGWACGRWGAMLHTADGGSTWVRQKSGTDYTLTAVRFVDAQTGWAVGDGGTILHTKDGGGTWTKQESPVDFFLMGAFFANSKKGWVVTARTHVLYTEDGGKSWEIQFQDEDFVLKAVSFCDEANGWAVGEYGYIYHTADGGRNWEHQAGDFGFSDETGEVVGGNLLFDVIALSPTTAWVVGIDGYVAKTTDGGSTWEEVSDGVPKAHLFGIASDGEGNVVIGGKGLLVNSSDGGKTFQVPAIQPPVTYGWIYRIIRRGTLGFVAAGKEGSIYLSNREGTSWKQSGVP